jgi:acyl carrier protein
LAASRAVPDDEATVTDEQMRSKAGVLLRDHLGLDRDVTDATTLDELHADALDRIEVGMALEEEFDIAIPDNAIGEWRTVGDLLDWLVARKARPS